MVYYNRLIIYFDGASKNNPRGSAGCGWHIKVMDHNGANDEEIAYGYIYLGHNISNNQAEYEGLEGALRCLRLTQTSCHRLYIRGDSQIVITQLDGLYQVRSYKHVDRSRNCRTDHFANYDIITKGGCTCC